MTKTIGRWEKFKRVVANSFDIQTEGQIREYYEELERQEAKEKAAAFLAQRKAELEIEYERPLFKLRQEEFKRKLAEQQAIEDAKYFAELEAKKQEAIRLHKENKWYEAYDKKQREEITEE